MQGRVGFEDVLYGVEDGVQTLLGFGRGLGMQHRHGLLLGDGEAAADKAPVLFGLAHTAFVADGKLADGFVEGEDEMESGLEVVGVVVLDAEGEEGVEKYAAAYHEVFDLGKTLVDAAVVGEGAKVAVVNDFMAQKGQHPFEGVKVYMAGVLLPPGAGMDDFDSFRPEDMNSLLVPVKNLVNTMYSKDLSKKIWATSQRKKKEGELLGNGCVYGYIKNQETGKLEIDPMTAVNVQMIFQWKLLGLSTCRIAENLTLMGAPTPRQRQKELGILKKEPGSKWETASISSILKSEYYIGNTVTNKTSTKIFEGKEKRRTDPSEWIITENTHEAIIAKDDFEAIQKSMNEKAEKRAASLEATAKINEKYPDQLKGLLFCGKCGKRMIIDRLPHGAVSSVKTVVYVCRQRGRSNNCSGHSISENLLKMLIMERISRTAKECCDAAELWNKTEAMRGRDNPVNKVKAEIQKVTAHLNGISDKRSTLYENLSNGVIDRDEFRLLQDNYKRQHEDGEKELKALEDKLSEIEEAAKQYLNSAEALKKYVSCRAFDEDIVRELVERVDVFPDKHIHVTFRFKNPFEKEGSKDDSSV